jgi:hypothetical protein
MPSTKEEKAGALTATHMQPRFYRRKGQALR